MGTKRTPKAKEDIYEFIKLGIKNSYNKITFMTSQKFEDKSIIDRLGLTELKELPAKYVVTKWYKILLRKNPIIQS